MKDKKVMRRINHLIHPDHHPINPQETEHLHEVSQCIDALKAQNAELLIALHNLTENVIFYHGHGISDLKDAKADRNNAVKIALIAIGADFDPDLEFNDWQNKDFMGNQKDGWA